MDVCDRSLACSIRRPSLGSGTQPETSESGVIAYVTMIGSWCQRPGSRNLSGPARILSFGTPYAVNLRLNQGEDGAGPNRQSRST
jgi:hypothetical protein